MNANEELTAIIAGKGASEPAKGVDWEAKCHELENKLNSVRVEEGRVAKLAAELKERDAELERLRQSKAAEEVTSSLTNEEREALAPEVISAIGKATATAKADAERRIRELEEQRRQEREAGHEAMLREFLMRVDREFPGVRASITEGGANREAWLTYYGPNKQSIDHALQNGDFDAFAYHLKNFYRYHLESELPSSKGPSAPEPTPKRGGKSPAVELASDRVYTAEEYQQLEERAMKLRAQGKYEEYRKLSDELDTILSEGRVKD